MRYCAATVFTPVFATLLFTSFSTIPLSASQCEAARVICGPGATGERMGFAVEMYFDEKTEKALRDLRKVLGARHAAGFADAGRNIWCIDRPSPRVPTKSDKSQFRRHCRRC